MDNKKVSVLILLDLSSAFDTIDHHILLSRLSSYFGISGLALQLLTSYLQNRTQTVCIDSNSSPPSLLSTGIPQGSVLGPLLFSPYTTPLSQILQGSGVSFHFYADDTQLYISFSPALSHTPLSLLSSTLDLVHTWFTNNRLCLNPSKTEYIIIGSPYHRSKISSTAISISGNQIKPVTSARNLGIIFDSDLSLRSIFLPYVKLLSIIYANYAKLDLLSILILILYLLMHLYILNLITATHFTIPYLIPLYIDFNLSKILLPGYLFLPR